MKSHYTNANHVALLLFCLLATSVSADSFIRQVTSDFNTNQQQEGGAVPEPNEYEVHYLNKNQEFSLRDQQVSALSTVTGLRDRPPSSYSLKMESYSTLLKSTYAERYKSRPFSADGYNWTLFVYPNGNKKDNGAGYLSLYVAIENSTLVAEHHEVYADIRFYVYNKIHKKYFTIQDTNVWRFNIFQTIGGFSQVLSVDNFKDPKHGYLYDGDHCEFGVDVTIPTVFQKSELFSITENFLNPRFTWKIRGFSTLLKDYYLSDMFSIGGRNWKIKLYPNGVPGMENYLSMFLDIDNNQTYRPYEKIYVRAKFEVLNQRNLSNKEDTLDSWYKNLGYGGSYGWGFDKFMSLSDLKDSSKAFIVNDMLMVQVEMEAISSTKYLPS